MNGFRTITPEELPINPFQGIGKDWMLVTARQKDSEKVNSLTASWGGMGILWNKPVAFVFLRPQRYTRELVDEMDSFSLTFFSEDYRKQLNFCGANSGRDVDKPAECGFDIAYDDSVPDAPFYTQAHTVILCKKLYRQPMEPGCMIDTSINGAHYPDHDHHILYVGGIQRILSKN